MNANHIQAELIRRYHRKLSRSQDITLEAAARAWIVRFSKRFRSHYHPERKFQ